MRKESKENRKGSPNNTDEMGVCRSTTAEDFYYELQVFKRSRRKSSYIKLELELAIS